MSGNNKMNRAWQLLKELWASLILTGLALFYLYHLILIRIFKQVTIMESNYVILYGEIVLLIAVAILGIERIIDDIKRRKR